MATEIILDSVQLNLASDLAQYQKFSSMAKLQTEFAQSGEVRDYASSRKRAVLRGSVGNTFQLDLPDCTRTQIDWLKARTAQLMLVRDDRGTKFYGVYFKVTSDEHSEDTNYGDVTLVIQEVTYSEAV